MENFWQNYIRYHFIEEVGRLQRSGFHYFSVVIMVQVIEFLGGMLDNKPLRARNQSKNRFRLAIAKLFDSRYQRLNNNDWLYDKLRNHMVHAFIPSSLLKIISAGEKGNSRNLEKEGDILVIVSEELFSDFTRACQKVIYLIDSGKIPAKKINPMTGF